MNKLGIHSQVWEAGWSRDACARAIARTAESGFDFIEVDASDPASIDADFTRHELEKHGLGVSFSLSLDTASDISSGNPEQAERGKRTLEHAVRVAGDCGAQYVCGILYSAFHRSVVSPTAEGVAMSVDILSQVARTAAQSGIVLGLETVNRYESNVLNTAGQAVEMCKRIGLPNVKVHLDTYHMNIEESDVAAAIRNSGAYLGYFHVGDSHRGYLGSGSIDFARVFRALVSSGYTGPIAFESFSPRVLGESSAGSVAIWRNLWDDSSELAVHALTYMRAQLKSAQEAFRQTGRDCLR